MRNDLHDARDHDATAEIVCYTSDPAHVDRYHDRTSPDYAVHRHAARSKARRRARRYGTTSLKEMFRL